MNIYTVSFFGHREIDDFLEIEDRLENIICELLQSKVYIRFLVGRNGEFDLLVSSVIRRCVKRYESYDNTSFILILPYMRAEYIDNMESFHEYYDDVEICSESNKAHFKAAIQIRNRNMVDRSNLVVCCIQRKKGGAYTTIKYAEKQNRLVLNVAEEILPTAIDTIIHSVYNGNS